MHRRVRGAPHRAGRARRDRPGRRNLIRAQCCIAGGGPAGMMLGWLLARAGIHVLVIEKHRDFFRDFRGDTIHPSTLEIMHELGVLEEFLELPHQKTPVIAARFGGDETVMADFTGLPARCPFIAMMPQWDFLDFIARVAGRYPTFDLRMAWEATGVIEDAGRVVGVSAATPEGQVEIRADLVVAADGRRSTIRHAGGFQVREIGAPMDVLWFRVSRNARDPARSTFFIEAGHLFIMLDRGDYWQMAYVIAKGDFQRIRASGLRAFHAELLRVAPFIADRLTELDDWERVKLLSVRVDRLRRWYRPGLLCIGDAAHAMSPIGGVGINLAVQDAVAAANVLVDPLRAGHVTEERLAAVQRRREFPTRMTQRIQVLIQNGLIRPVLSASARTRPPLLFRIARNLGWVRQLIARFVGLGIRPEHVETAEAGPPAA